MSIFITLSSFFFFFKQKTAYEMRISDWSSDVCSSDLDVYGGSIAPILPYVKDKSVKCLILSSVNRVKALPQASSLTDLGIPQEQTLLWHGIIAPKGVPADRLKILEDAFRKSANTQQFKDFLASQSISVEGTSAKDMRMTLDDEYAAMARVAKANRKSTRLNSSP